MSDKKAYIIDDSKSARVMLTRMLAKNDLSVTQYESGEEFLAALDDLPPPSVIFVDHMMPGKNGLETTQLIREKDGFQDVPVYMYTSKDDTDYELTAREHGATGVLQKPAKPDALCRILGIDNQPKESPALNRSVENASLIQASMKELKAIQERLNQLESENSDLKSKLAVLENASKPLPSTDGHGEHITQASLNAALKQINIQFDQKLVKLTNQVSKRLENIEIPREVLQEIETSLTDKATKAAEKSAEQIASSQAQAVAAKVAAAQSELTTREALKSVYQAVKIPKVIAVLCIILTTFSIALHFF